MDLKNIPSIYIVFAVLAIAVVIVLFLASRKAEAGNGGNGGNGGDGGDGDGDNNYVVVSVSEMSDNVVKMEFYNQATQSIDTNSGKNLHYTVFENTLASWLNTYHTINEAQYASAMAQFHDLGF